MKPDTRGSLRLRAERAEARVANLEAENATLRFNAAATPKPRPSPELHGWDVQ